jgi:hypothetical protein
MEEKEARKPKPAALNQRKQDAPWSRHLFEKPVSSELYKQKVLTAYITKLRQRSQQPQLSHMNLLILSCHLHKIRHRVGTEFTWQHCSVAKTSLYSVSSRFTGEWRNEADTEGNSLILLDVVTKLTKADQRIRVSYIVNIQFNSVF